MATKTTIHGFTVSYEENATYGAHYLRNDLSRDEAKIFFEHARRKSSAQFEDSGDRQYTLFHSNGTFVITRR